MEYHVSDSVTARINRKRRSASTRRQSGEGLTVIRTKQHCPGPTSWAEAMPRGIAFDYKNGSIVKLVIG